MLASQDNFFWEHKGPILNVSVVRFRSSSFINRDRSGPETVCKFLVAPMRVN